MHGKGIANQHKSREDEERIGVTWHLGSGFMGPEDTDERMQPCLVEYGGDKECFWAVCADAKGPTDAMVKRTTEKLNDPGDRGEKITMKPGQEESVVLKRRLALLHVKAKPYP